MGTPDKFALRNGDWFFKSLMGSGVILCGRTSDLEAGTRLASELVPAAGSYVKRYEPVIGSDGQEIAQRRIDLSLQEKLLLDAQELFKNKPTLKFLVNEYGDDQLRPLPLAEQLDPGIFPDEHRIAEFRAQLSERTGGIPIETILAQIRQRQERLMNGDVGPAKAGSKLSQQPPGKDPNSYYKPPLKYVTLNELEPDNYEGKSNQTDK
jgi:hypothetical protein